MSTAIPPAPQQPPPQRPPSAQQPPPPRDPLIEPGRRLSPSRGRDRPWRLLVTLVGGATVLLVVLALAALSTATWLTGRGYTEIPAITQLGSPSSLSLTSRTGTVRVLPSNEVDELTLGLVEPGATTLPDPAAQVRARVTADTASDSASVDVRQPDLSFDPPWADSPQDVLLLVPAGLDLALEVSTDAGDVHIDGDYTAVEARSDVGNIRLGPVTAPQGVTASAEVGNIDIELGSPAPAAVDLSATVGDVDLLLPTDAGGRVSVTTELGDIEVAAPGTARWSVEASSEYGAVQQDPGLTEGSAEAEDDAAGILTVSSELGTIVLTR